LLDPHIPDLPSFPTRRSSDLLQHQVIRGTKDAENFMVNPNVLANLDIKPTQAPDLSLLSPALQQYVMTIAQGLQSSDPTQGLYRSEEHTSELQSRENLVCRLL